MQAYEIRIRASAHPGQYEIHYCKARFKVLAAGRRWGKTWLGVNECLDVASRGGRAWWVAPTYKTGEVGWRPLLYMAQKIGAEIKKVDKTIILPGAGSVTVRSADNPDSLRGDGLDFVAMDECAYIAEEAWTEAIRPALSDRKGKAMFYSTPAGRNWFWNMYMRGSQGEDEWKSWQLPTSSNPYIDPEEIEAARRDLPELTFMQEYEAIFLENEGSVFRNIGKCLNATKTKPKDHAGHYKTMGVDWAKKQDFTAISVGCRDCGMEIFKDRFNKINYGIQSQRVYKIAKEWDVNDILVELNSIGEPQFERLEGMGLPVRGFKTTRTSKTPLIQNFQTVLENEEFQFIDDPVWTGELEAYEQKVIPETNQSQFSAPAGYHDDTVIARALMLDAQTNASWFIY